MDLPAIDSQYLTSTLVELLNIPSPTGFCEEAIAWSERMLGAFPGAELARTRKGGLLATFAGEREDQPRALTAHVDTLGGVVKEIKANGRLKLTALGGMMWTTVEGEGVTIFTSGGGQVRGSFLISKPSTHVYSREVVRTMSREDDTMEVRLDELTTSAEQTRALGIEVGDFAAFDPRVELRNGFIRSRFLDDKAGVAAVLAALKAMNDAGLKPCQKTYLFLANYEEIGGHGASAGIPDDAAEVVAIDMAAIGEGQNSDEFHPSLGIKDAGGPYHHGLSQRLRRIAEKHGIAYKTDLFTYYVSDGMAYWRAGGDAAVALFGPGIDASHNYERTHIDSLVGTAKWVMAYLMEEAVSDQRSAVS